MLNTYHAGWRAGMTEPKLQIKGGTRNVKILVTPECPHKRFWQFLARYGWENGYIDGLKQRVTKDYL